MQFLTDLNRSRVWDALIVDQEVEDIATQHAKNILLHCPETSEHFKLALLSLTKAILNISALARLGRTVGMQMSEISFEGKWKKILYVFLKILSDHKPNSFYLHKIEHSFRAAVFFIFIATGKYFLLLIFIL